MSGYNNITIREWYEILDMNKKHTIAGNVKIINSFYMPQLNRHRRIWLYLPPDYESSHRSYPVLYMHDGQNLFDEAEAFAGEWRVDKVLDGFFYEGLHGGVIVVGIESNEHRMNELMPGREGELYLDFLVGTLKPFIDHNLRTIPFRESTMMMGASMGGLITLYGGLKYQHLFSQIGALSPTLIEGWGGDRIKDFRRTYDMKIYLDTGDFEAHNNTLSRHFAENVLLAGRLLQENGWHENNICCFLEQGRNHGERFWRERFPYAFSWLVS